MDTETEGDLTKKIYVLMKDLKNVHIRSVTSTQFGMGIISLNGTYDELLREAKQNPDEDSLSLLDFYHKRKKEYISSRQVESSYASDEQFF